MGAAIIAVAALLAAGPAVAGTSLLPRLAEADRLLNEPPYACNPDKTDCELLRGGSDPKKGNWYAIHDHPNGVGITCYQPGDRTGAGSLGVLRGWKELLGDQRMGGFDKITLNPRCKALAAKTPWNISSAYRHSRGSRPRGASRSPEP